MILLLLVVMINNDNFIFLNKLSVNFVSMSRKIFKFLSKSYSIFYAIMYYTYNLYKKNIITAAKIKTVSSQLLTVHFHYIVSFYVLLLSYLQVGIYNFNKVSSNVDMRVDSIIRTRFI